MLVNIVTGFILFYLIFTFVILRLIVPYFSFGFKGFPKRIPEEIKAAILDLELQSVSQESYLEAVYALVMDKVFYQWGHTRFRAALNFPRAFIKNLEEIWSTKKFVYCTSINYVLYSLLVGSKYFKASDIRIKHVFLNFIVHQYIQVKIGDKWIDVDPAGAGIRGKPIGNHAEFFG